MKNFEGDSAVLLQGESHNFKDPKAIQSALQTASLAFFFLVLSLQPKRQHEGHPVYSQTCGSTELNLFGDSLITYRSTALLS